MYIRRTALAAALMVAVTVFTVGCGSFSHFRVSASPRWILTA